jgi:hypothetical protein
MPDINAAQILRFEDGGKVTIRDQGGATDLVVLNILEGTLTFTPPVRAGLPRDIDRGLMNNNRRRGNQQPGSVGFDCKFTGGISATELFSLLTDEGDLDAGYMQAYEVQVDFYNGPSQEGVGKTFLFEHCTREEAPVISAGAEYDTITCRFDCTTVTPTGILAIP